MTERAYYHPADVARLLDVSTKTVYRWLQTGQVEHLHLPSGRIRISRDEFLKMIVSKPRVMVKRVKG